MGPAPVYPESDREGREIIESVLFVILSPRSCGSINKQMSLFPHERQNFLFADLARTRHSQRGQEPISAFFQNPFHQWQYPGSLENF